MGNMRKVIISDELVELYKLLKFENLVASGGEACGFCVTVPSRSFFQTTDEYCCIYKVI